MGGQEACGEAKAARKDPGTLLLALLAGPFEVPRRSRPRGSMIIPSFLGYDTDCTYAPHQKVVTMHLIQLLADVVLLGVEKESLLLDYAFPVARLFPRESKREVCSYDGFRSAFSSPSRMWPVTMR